VDKIVLAGLGVLEYLLCRLMARQLDAAPVVASGAVDVQEVTLVQCRSMSDDVARRIDTAAAEASAEAGDDDRIEFSRDDGGRLVARPSSSHFNLLAGQLTSDIASYTPDCLELLHVIDEVRSGRAPIAEYEGNSSIFRVTQDGVTVKSLGPMGLCEDYTFEEAQSAVLQYFDFLAPTDAAKKDAVAHWENEFGRPYPGKAELGLAQDNRPG